MTIATVVFPVGEDQYAVAADTVREVITDPQPTRLPTAPAVLLGAFNLRGEVVPMFDAAALLGIGTLVDAPCAVVVTTAQGPAGLVVSGLPKVANLDEPVAAADLRGALGVYDVDGGLAVLIDVEALLLSQLDLDVDAVTGGSLAP